MISSNIGEVVSIFVSSLLGFPDGNLKLKISKIIKIGFNSI